MVDWGGVGNADAGKGGGGCWKEERDEKVERENEGVKHGGALLRWEVQEQEREEDESERNSLMHSVVV